MYFYLEIFSQVITTLFSDCFAETNALLFFFFLSVSHVFRLLSFSLSVCMLRLVDNGKALRLLVLWYLNLDPAIAHTRTHAHNTHKHVCRDLLVESAVLTPYVWLPTLQIYNTHSSEAGFPEQSPRNTCSQQAERVEMRLWADLSDRRASVTLWNQQQTPYPAPPACEGVSAPNTWL